jgi:hypothetical protein
MPIGKESAVRGHTRFPRAHYREFVGAPLGSLQSRSALTVSTGSEQPVGGGLSGRMHGLRSAHARPRVRPIPLRLLGG